MFSLHVYHAGVCTHRTFMRVGLVKLEEAKTRCSEGEVFSPRPPSLMNTFRRRGPGKGLRRCTSPGEVETYTGQRRIERIRSFSPVHPSGIFPQTPPPPRDNSSPFLSRFSTLTRDIVSSRLSGRPLRSGIL